MAMRNYGAMSDAKLLAAVADLRAGTGEATAKAVKGGRSAEEDLPAATAAAHRRGLLPPGDDEAWDAACEAAVERLDAIGVPEAAAAAVRPTGRLVAGPAGTSQLGGTPRLEPGTAWPERRGRPLDHLAQVDLATAPDALRRLGLPDRGLLTFFYDGTAVNEGEGGWGEWPDDVGAGVLLLVNPETAVRDGDDAGTPFGFELEADLAGVLGVLEDADDEELEDVVEQLHELVFDEERRGWGGGHKVLGASASIQDSVLLECPTKADHEKPPAGVPDLRAAQASDWRLLFQLDSDDELEWMWGDAGTVYVCLQHDDLVAGRWDRIWAVMQSS